MEYATSINDTHVANNMYMRHVAYDQTDCGTEQLFSHENIKHISRKITELLMGVDPENRPIIVPNKTIESVMSAVFSAFKPQYPGEPITVTSLGIPEFIAPGNRSCSNTQYIIDQVIEIIVSDVKNNLGIEQCNSKLSIWDSVLGDFNRHGLMPHSQLKINNRKPPTQINMRY